jgi:hypothetical protein
MANDFDETKNISVYSKIVAVWNFLNICVDFFFLLRKKYRNYFLVLIHLLKRKYPITAELRKGKSIVFDNYYELYSNLLGIDCDTKNDVVYINGLQFFGGVSNSDSVKCFISKEYDFLPVKDSVVIDIGANIGDSSIYFALNGAKRVIAIEPNNRLYEFATRNIQTNGFSDKIELINSACCGAGEHINSEHGAFITLDDLVQKYLIKPSNLKIDCEGCEYNVIISTPCTTLVNFTHIQIEYHHGYENLKNKLEHCGFQVKVTQPSYFTSPFGKLSDTELVGVNNDHLHSKPIYSGMLYAYRV